MTIKGSDAVTLFSLPGPDRPRAKFRYNFFVPDESVDDQGLAAQAIVDPSPDKKPRYIRVEIPYSSRVAPFSSVTEDTDPKGNVLRTLQPIPLGNILNREEAESVQTLIMDELTAPDKVNFSALNFQELNANDKLFNLAATTVRKRIITQNKRVNDNIDDIKKNFLQRQFQSQADLTRFARQDRGVPVQNGELANMLNQIEQENEYYVDEESQEVLTRDVFEDIKKVNFKARFNNKFVSSILRTGINDSLGTYTEELTSVAPAALAKQEQAISAYRAGDPENVFDLNLRVLSDVIVDVANLREDIVLGTRNPLSGRNPVEARHEKTLNCVAFTHAGYLIEKNEIGTDGTIRRRTLNFNSGAETQLQNVIDTPGRKNFIDYEVAYGRTYSYAVSALYVGEINLAVRQENPQNPQRPFKVKTYRFLVSSVRSPAIFVECAEKIPPKPPENLKIMWHQSVRSPLITWEHPLNPQRDVKRFQVLKRKNIDEPFELLIEYDFDNSEVKYKSVEDVSSELKQFVKRPMYHFIDTSFDDRKPCIYTVRSVDAHGLISAYSEQIKATYNQFTNKIDSELVSTRGASAQYPNFNIISRKFSPTIKDSNHRRLKIYFDPEYLDLYKQGQDGSPDQSLPLFNKENEGSSRRGDTRFKLQVLNVDLQQSEIIDIVISDNRSE